MATESEGERTCPACHSHNEADSDTCFQCGETLLQSAAIIQGTVLQERYEILDRLGKGGMGTVYKARDRVLDEVVAVKVLSGDISRSPDGQRRFRSEIKLARRVAHKNVCRIYEYGEAADIRYISMEFVEGVDVRLLMSAKGRFSAGEAYEISLQTVEGLQAIHEAGIVHRDLKPANLMIDRNGVVKLMDFGLAKRLPSEDLSTIQTTATGLVVGTLHYMSPEQAKAETIDLRSDIYSFGIVVFELFTGDRPFRAVTPLEVIYKHVHEPPPLDGPTASNIPGPLVPVLAKALSKNPDDRYQTVVEMAAAIRSARSQQQDDLSADLMTLSTVTRAARQADMKTVSTPPARRPKTAEARAPAKPPSLTVRHRPGTTQADLNVPGTRSGAMTMVFVLFVLLAGALGGWWWAHSREQSGRNDQEATLSQQPMSAGPTTSVRFNALPWARIEIRPLATPLSVPVLPASERTTPFLIWLAPGEYVVELENGGLTPPLKETVRVEAGRANEFVFTMPGYDPQSVAAF